jgi:hypothetical protein
MDSTRGWARLMRGRGTQWLGWRTNEIAPILLQQTDSEAAVAVLLGWDGSGHHRGHREPCSGADVEGYRIDDGRLRESQSGRVALDDAHREAQLGE